MANPKTRSPIDLAALKLRELALALEEGAFLGSEDELISRLGVARVTVRQAARLLEREGVLFVRRGINGGYFASRPSVEMVESVLCTYLETLGLDTRHTGNVTTALWTEVLREAASADRNAVNALAELFIPQVERLSTEASLEAVAELQLSIRTAIFDLIGGTYIELLFRINTAFSRKQISGITQSLSDDAHDRAVQRLGDDAHRRFVLRWKEAVQMELRAIVAGDPMLAMMAALHERSVWLDRGRNGIASAEAEA
jgi:GntR family transcriptional regulator, transcriptional repressor for pyruvate dehydrogenase complex